jgi:hypothetical protein
MLAIAVLAAQYAGTFEVLDTTRIQARASQPAPIVSIATTNSNANANTPTQGQDVLSVDVSTLPTARLRLRDRFWDWMLSYAPNLTAGAIELGLNPQISQSGAAAVAWHERSLRLSLSEAGTYGQINSAFLQPTQTGQSVTLQPAASFSTIDFASSMTNFTASFLAGRSAAVFLSGTYFVSGGLTTGSQAVLPRQYGPRVDVGVSDAISRLDTLSTMATAQETNTYGACPNQTGTPVQYCAEQAALSLLQETLRHQLSPVSTLSVGGGVAASIIQPPGLAKELVIQPTFSAVFSYRFGTSAGLIGLPGTAAASGATGSAAASSNAGVAPSETSTEGTTGQQPASGTTASAASTAPAPGGSPQPTERSTAAGGAPPSEQKEGAGGTLPGQAEAGTSPATGVPTGRMNEVVLSVNISPLVDPRTGLISERAQTMAAFSRFITGTTSVRASVSLLQSVPIPTSDPYAITSVNGGIEGRVRLNPQVDLTFGLLELWQEQAGYGNLTSTIGYVSVTVAAPVLRF